MDKAPERPSEPTAVLPFPGRLSLVLVALLSSVGFSSLAPVLPKISEHFAGEPGADILVRAMVTAVGGAMAIGGPLAGMLAERFGERRILCAALLLFGVVGTCGYVIDNPWALLASRIVVGLALTATGVVALAMIANGTAAASRNRWLGYFAVFASLGTIPVMFAAALMGAIDWRLVFLLHLAAAPILLLVLLLVPAVRTARSEAATTRPSGFPFGVMLVGLSCGAVGATLPAFIPFQLQSIGRAAPGDVATIIATLTLAAATASYFYGAIRSRVRMGQVFIGGFLLIGMAIAAMTAADSFVMTCACMFFVGLGTGALGPNLFALAATSPAEQRARRMGVARGAYYGAPLVAQLFLEPLVAGYGPTAAFYALATFAGLMAAMAMILELRLAKARLTVATP